jgi:hypothetical protein
MNSRTPAPELTGREVSYQTFKLMDERLANSRFDLMACDVRQA